MSFMARLAQACAELEQDNIDPWKRVLENAVRDVETIGSAALLDLLRVPSTTGNARRLAKNMRSLGFKSRRLMPGGFRDTTTRGWTRPTRHAEGRMDLEEGKKVNLNLPTNRATTFKAQ